MTVLIRQGFAEADRDTIAQLYWQAFGGKLGRVMRPETKALRFVTRVMRADHALAAYTPDGTVLGVVGFKSARGSFVGGGLADLAAIYGAPGALWRWLLLAALHRDVENARFLLDGLFVRPEARGQGVGRALLAAVAAEARARGYRELRLDVIDTNPRARALYERDGFRALRIARMGPLRLLFGFSSATVMVKPLG